MEVEVKGGDTTTINSCHRFLLSAQVKDGEAIPTEDDERRYFIIRSSDELCTGCREHHTAFAELIERESHAPRLLRLPHQHARLADHRQGGHRRGDDRAPARAQRGQRRRRALRGGAGARRAAQATRRSVAGVDGFLFLQNGPLYERFNAFCYVEAIGGQPAQAFRTRLGTKFKDDTSVSSVKQWVPELGKEVRGWKFHIENLREAYPTLDEAEEEREKFTQDDYAALARLFLVPLRRRRRRAERRR